MAYVSMKQMLETGVHFGHQTRRWNPKMRQYIFGVRNGIHIIDLQQTVKLYKAAHDKIVDVAASGGKILFVGTKRQAQEAIMEEAKRCGQFYITNRWLGGTLTNHATITQSINRLKKIDKMFEDKSTDAYNKKEILELDRERKKLEAAVGGIKDMNGLPDIVFIIDPHRETIAIKECKKLRIPVVAVTDSNCDPEPVDFVIPGNDDAIRSIKLFVAAIADATLEGIVLRKGSSELSVDDEVLAKEMIASADEERTSDTNVEPASVPVEKNEDSLQE
ncbi:MAG: 30S ribosomal protein S2 [Desulfovibrionaceae bacterium]